MSCRLYISIQETTLPPMGRPHLNDIRMGVHGTQTGQCEAKSNEPDWTCPGRLMDTLLGGRGQGGGALCCKSLVGLPLSELYVL